MLLRLAAFFVFMVGLIVGALWVVVSLGDAIASGADDVWYLAVAVTLAAAILAVLALLRSRTRAMVGFTAAATIVLAAVLVTYPSGGASCEPTSAQQQGTTTIPQDDTGNDLFEDVSTTPIGHTAADCS